LKFSSAESFINEDYLVFPTVIAGVTLPTPLGGDSLGTSIRHPTPDQSVTPLERPLNALEPDTFYDTNCRAGRGDFNGPEIMGKGEGLTQQMHWGILRVLAARSFSCHHLSPPGLISAR